MYEATGEALSGEDGLPRVGMTEFVAESADGTVDVEVTLDTRELAGHDLVFFEKLADSQENVIATHEDLNDEGQTVSIPAEETPGKGYPKTGAFADVVQ